VIALALRRTLICKELMRDRDVTALPLVAVERRVIGFAA
jgi:hypothetical protein